MKIVDFIVCDDIRQEVGNKVSLIGVYDETLILAGHRTAENKWPIRMKLSFFCRCVISKDEQAPNKFIMDIVSTTGDEKPKTFSVEGVIAPQSKEDSSRTLNLVIVAEGFPIHGLGHLTFELKFYNNDNLVVQSSPDYQLKIKTSKPVSLSK